MYYNIYTYILKEKFFRNKMKQIEKSTLESIVTRFRRESIQINKEKKNKEKNIELEIRFQNIDLLTFTEIYEGLKSNSKESNIYISQIISAVVDDNIKYEGFQKFYRSFNRRDITYKSPNYDIKEEIFMVKQTLLIPLKVTSSKGINYTVSIASENETNTHMSMDEGSIVRIKSRISFPITIDASEDKNIQLLWRVDLSIVSQITGNEAKTKLKPIKKEMFLNSTPQNFLTDMKLTDTKLTDMKLTDTKLTDMKLTDMKLTDMKLTDTKLTDSNKYKFEVEIEFISSSETCDILRPSDITNITEKILKIINSEHANKVAQDSLLQNEIYKVAQYIIKAPGYLAQFQQQHYVSKQSSNQQSGNQQSGNLKKLLPQVLAITRTDYRNLYPPKNLFITDKADGKRAIAIIRDGKAIIISNSIIEGGIINHDPKYQLDTILDGEYVATPRRGVSVDGGDCGGGNDGGGNDGGDCGGGNGYSDGDSDDGDRVGNKSDTSQTTITHTPSQRGDTTITHAPSRRGDFYAFDAIVINGINVSNQGFEERVTYLANACILLSDLGIKSESKPFTQITDIDNLEPLIKEVYERKRPYEKDGLIFVENGKSYSDTNTYKWKPAHDNTIDFLVKKAPSSILGKYPFIEKEGHQIYLLFVGINNEMFESLALQWCPGYSQIFQKSISNDNSQRNYFPIQFSPSDVPLAYIYHHPVLPGGRLSEDNKNLGEKSDDNSTRQARKEIRSLSAVDIDGKIVEMRCAGNCSAAGGHSQFVDWEILRIRDDREVSKNYYGNDYYTAELIWLNYVDPFPLEQLWEGVSMDYFMSEKNGIYKAQVSVISFIKTERINTLAHSNWIIDLGMGKGQDLGRYMSAGIQNLIAVDADKAALSELVRRKYSHAKNEKKSQNRNGKYSKSSNTSKTSVYVIVSDINYDTEILTKFHNLGLETADAIVCNLAIHYFLSTSESLTNFMNIVSNMVKVGGQVCITCMFGEAIHALFKKEKISENESYNVHENGVLKYSIKRMYSSTKLESVGQKIGIMLPFSIGQYYEEYLVNTKELINTFKSYGFSCSVNETMNKSLPRFQSRNNALYSILTEDDKFYLSLYGELVFTRRPVLAGGR